MIPVITTFIRYFYVMDGCEDQDESLLAFVRNRFCNKITDKNSRRFELKYEISMNNWFAINL